MINFRLLKNCLSPRNNTWNHIRATNFSLNISLRCSFFLFFFFTFHEKQKPDLFSRNVRLRVSLAIYLEIFHIEVSAPQASNWFEDPLTIPIAKEVFVQVDTSICGEHFIRFSIGRRDSVICSRFIFISSVARSVEKSHSIVCDMRLNCILSLGWNPWTLSLYACMSTTCNDARVPSRICKSVIDTAYVNNKIWYFTGKTIETERERERERERIHIFILRVI